MIICQRCNRRPAQIQSQQIGVDGRPIFINLCEFCFQEIQAGSNKTSYLDKYGRDLTRLAQQGRFDPVVGRGEEIERLIHILSRRSKNNPVLVGDPGVGKTAIVEGLAQRIAENKIVETLRGKRIIALDLPLMLAGAAHRGEFEQRLRRTLDEVIRSKGNIIIFIDELHNIVGAGSAPGAIDAANILKPSLSRGELQAIGATTMDEFRMVLSRDGALERRFQPVFVEEPTVAQTVEILRGLRQRYEQHHQVIITDEAIAAAVELADRYLTERFLPDKAIDLLDEASSAVRLKLIQEPANLLIVEDEIAELENLLGVVEDKV